MAHIFFEKLEKRQSTQTFFPSIGSSSPFQTLYGVSVPVDTGWSNIWSNPTTSTPVLVYGIAVSPPYSNPAGSYFPWTSPFNTNSFLPSYYSPYSFWSNPFNQNTAWSPFSNFWGSG